jgi:hypothetical protein
MLIQMLWIFRLPTAILAIRARQGLRSVSLQAAFVHGDAVIQISFLSGSTFPSFTFPEPAGTPAVGKPALRSHAGDEPRS